MSKTPAHELRELVAEELITYLGEGVLNRDQYAESLDYSGIEIEDFDQLKKLHFVLHGDVVEYIDRLPDRLRRIKTITRQQTETVRGEVRGTVNWQQTTRERGSLGYNDPTLFVVSNPEVEYDIPENRVLKKLLSVIAEPLTEDVESVDRDWREQWDDQDIVSLQQTLAHNIYLDSLPAPDEIRVSDRDLETARRSRHRLYSRSYELYQLYEDLMNNRFEKESVRNLLNETLVTPTEDYTLFELFCVFGVMRRLRSRYPGIQLKRIDSSTEMLAELEGPEQRLEVYYDQNGPLKFFELYPSSDELAGKDVPEMIRRHATALEAHGDALEEFLSRGSQHSFYSGRPDFLVLRYTRDDPDSRFRSENLAEAIIGEVKYTRNKSTFSEGLRELMEYIHFARTAEDYLFGTESGSIDVNGVLCTDGVATNTDSAGIVDHATTLDLLRSKEEG
ncbi:hypothetical protein [Haloarchaeobius sp. TZWSO28]|uniref:hypothetical protein n=1 Tax=Haloarchaeobius sp. TZWSO28 TaxID=3446119 RepID=UPI003EB8297A